MAKLSAYVSKQVAQATAVVLVGFVGLDFIFRVVDELGNVEGAYTAGKALLFELLRTPETLYSMMPMVGLIGCLAGLGSLASTSELTVMRAAGVSTLRLVLIALKPAFIFLLVAMSIGEFIAPETSRMSDVLRDTARNKYKQFDISRGLWLRDQERFVSINAADGKGLIHGLSIFDFDENKRLKQLTSAKKAIYNRDHWLLEDVSQISLHLDSQPMSVTHQELETYRWQSEIEPGILALSAIKQADKLGMQDLWRFMQYREQQQLNTDEYALAFWKRFFFPLVMLSLVLVGISFIFGPLREVTMGHRLFTGILIGVVFKTLQDALGPVSIVFGIEPFVAMLMPGLISALIGFGLLMRVR